MPGCTEVGLEGDLALYDPQKGRRKLYKYDKVFGVDSTQEEVYEDTKGLIRSVLDGVFLVYLSFAPQEIAVSWA